MVINPRGTTARTIVGPTVVKKPKPKQPEPYAGAPAAAAAAAGLGGEG